jgi:ribosomal protein L7/L12
MNVTITLKYEELQKIINESATMQRIINGENPIVKYRDSWFKKYGVKSMKEHQYHQAGSSKVTAIKELRDYFLSGVNEAFNRQVVAEGYEVHLTPLNKHNLGLAAAKALVEKYFY